MRARSLSLALAVSFAGLGLAACGSSSDSADTTVAVVEDTAAPEAAVETTAAAEAAADTTVAEAAVETTAAADTTIAGGTETTAAAAASGDPTGDALVAQVLQGMNNGAAPSPDEVKCVSGKTKPEELAAVMTASTSGSPDMKVLLPLMKAIFSCKPAGLATQFSSSFDTMPAAVTAEQKTCIAEELLDILSKDDTLLEAALTSTGGIKDMPAAERDAIIKKLTPAVDKCVSGDLRDQVIAELQK